MSHKRRRPPKALAERDVAIRYKADMPALQVALLASARRYVPSLVLAIRIARVFGKSAEEVFILEGEELP